MLVIDLSERKLLKETYMEMLGSWSKTLLKMMYGDDVQVVANVNEEETTGGPEFIIRGKHKDVKSYAMAIVAEKNYLDAYSRYGKSHWHIWHFADLKKDRGGRCSYKYGL